MELPELPTIAVDEIREIPRIPGDPAGNRPPVSGPVEFVSHVLTTLLDFDAGSLTAEWSAIGVQWRISSRDGQVRIINPGVEPTIEQSIFRNRLAHIGHRYMADQLYGGYSEVLLTQKQRTHRAAFYMANDGWRGYWVRIYTRIQRPRFP